MRLGFWLKKYLRSKTVIVIRFTLRYNGASWHVTVHHRHARFCIWSLRTQDRHWQHKKNVGFQVRLKMKQRQGDQSIFPSEPSEGGFRWEHDGVSESDCSGLCSWDGKQYEGFSAHFMVCPLGSILSRIRTCICLSLEFSFCISRLIALLLVHFRAKL